MDPLYHIKEELQHEQRIAELEAENQRLRLTLHTIMEGTGDTRGLGLIGLGELIGRIYDHAREALGG